MPFSKSSSLALFWSTRFSLTVVMVVMGLTGTNILVARRGVSKVGNILPRNLGMSERDYDSGTNSASKEENTNTRRGPSFSVDAPETNIPHSNMEIPNWFKSDVSYNVSYNVSYKSTQCPGIGTDATKESSHAIPRVEELQNASLCRSLAHQRKFFSVRDSVLSWIKSHEEQRYLLKGTGKKGRLFAFIINEKYAFRHIFKSGGTTVQQQSHRKKHVPQWNVGNRSLFTTVRDPIEHFLSGWAECGFRCFNDMVNLTTSDVYNHRVAAWLQYVRLPQKSRCLNRCMPHSMPQANYLWKSDNSRSFEWDEKLNIVGDLSELPGLLGQIGLHYDKSLGNGNVANNKEKKNNFPRKTSMLSNSTLQSICNYVALDYYLFSFVPPLACRKQLLTNIADMNITIQQW